MKNRPERSDLERAVKLEDIREALAELRRLMVDFWRDAEVRESLAEMLHYHGTAAAVRAAAELYRAAAMTGALGPFDAKELHVLARTNKKANVAFLPPLMLEDLRHLLPASGSFQSWWETANLAHVVGIEKGSPLVLTMLRDRDAAVREFGARSLDANDAAHALFLAERLAIETEVPVALALLGLLLPKHGRLVRAALELSPIAEQVVQRQRRNHDSELYDWVPTSYRGGWAATGWHEGDWHELRHEWRQIMRHFDPRHWDEWWFRWRDVASRFGGAPIPPFGSWLIPLGSGGPRHSNARLTPFTPAFYASDSILGAIEASTGLSLPNPVWVEHHWVPRFQYLDLIMDERGRRGVVEIVGAADWKTLLDKERSADAIRNEFAAARAEVVRFVHETRGQARGERQDFPFGKLPRFRPSKPGSEDAQTVTWATLAAVLPEAAPWEVAAVAQTERGRQLERQWQRYQAALYGEGGIAHRALQHGDASEGSAAEQMFRSIGRLLPKDAPLHPEGLLGNFHPADGRATLYAGMILAVAEREGWNPLELSLVALVHETAHAGIVKGLDSGGKDWVAWHSAGADLHEVLAMEVMLRALRRLNIPDATSIGKAVAQRCLGPAGAGVLSRLADERLRGYIARARAGSFASPSAANADVVGIDREHVEHVLAGLASWLPDLREDLLLAVVLSSLAATGDTLDPGSPLELNLNKVRARLAAKPDKPAPTMLGQLLEPVIRSRPELVAIVGGPAPPEVVAALERR